jgi:predicted O-methyltransferase YrrM
MDMTPQRWQGTNDYIRALCPETDEQMRTLMSRAVKAGLPPIAVSSDVGRLLMILAQSVAAGRERPVALELGTLAGYSGLWILKGLGPAGKLVTLEPVDKHADFAQGEFNAAGQADRVEIVRRPALQALPDLAARLGPESLDLVFVDAIKAEYPQYVAAVRPLIRKGGLLILDNALGSGNWWITDKAAALPSDARQQAEGADRANRLIAADPDFLTTIVMNREGVLIARRRA